MLALRKFLLTWQVATLIAISFAVYATSLGHSTFIRDDTYIIDMNPLLHHWRLLPQLLTTGYWDAVMGSSAAVKEFRPILMVSYFLNEHLFGPSPWSFHAVNVFLHACNGVLLFALFRRRYGESTAFLAALFFAILPIHSEAVGYISGRSEVLVLFFLLLTWNLTESGSPKTPWALATFAMALLVKEEAVVFPFVLIIDDYIQRKRLGDRARLYAGFFGVLLVYGAIRLVLWSHAFVGGVDFFAGTTTLVRLLTMARFVLAYYFCPMATGLRYGIEYPRAFYPLSGPHDVTAWIALAAILIVVSFAVYAVVRRKSVIGFWILTACLFLLPTSNLLLKLDTIGADRFLYIPSIAFCVALGFMLSRLNANPRIGLAAVLVLWYSAHCAMDNRIWASELNYSRAVLSFNPRSAKALGQLGYIEWQNNHREEAVQLMNRAAEIDPGLASNFYNLGCLYFEQGQIALAKNDFTKALVITPADPDTLTCIGVIAEREKHPTLAVQYYRSALRYQKVHSTARYNLARLELETGHAPEAVVDFKAFIEAAPDDARVPAVENLLKGLGKQTP